MSSTLYSPPPDFSVFPCIMAPIRESFRPKILKSSKKTRKFKKIIKDTPYDSDVESFKPRGLVKKPSKIYVDESMILKRKLSGDSDSFPKKMKDLNKSLQFMSVFLIIMKIYAILVKRVSNINQNIASRDFRGVWQQTMLICTELAKYLKDLTMKAKIVKSNDVKNLALFTESFYKSIKIYENICKKNKSLLGLFWKLGKFLGSLLKLLISLDYIFPLEVILPSNYLLVFAFGFKGFGLLRKAYRLIKSLIKRWNRPQRRFIILVKIIIVVFKMMVVILAILDMKHLAFYMVSGQVSLHFIMFCFSIREVMKSWFASKKKKEKIEEIKVVVCERKVKVVEEKEGSAKMMLARRFLETRMGKEEISI